MWQRGVADGATGYPNPISTVLPSGFQFVVGPAGVAFGRFAWADPDSGEVSNAYISDALLGVVLPQRHRFARNGFNLAYWYGCDLILRPGMFVTLANAGTFPMRFAQGARVGQQVWISGADGTPADNNISAVTDSGGAPVTDSGSQPVTSLPVYYPTRFTVIRGCAPGGIALISSFSTALA